MVKGILYKYMPTNNSNIDQNALIPTANAGNTPVAPIAPGGTGLLNNGMATSATSQAIQNAPLGQTQASPVPIANPAANTNTQAPTNLANGLSPDDPSNKFNTATGSLNDKYKGIHNTLQNSGTPVPDTSGPANAAITSVTPPPTPPPYDSTKADQVIADDKAHAQYLADYTAGQQSPSQAETLTQHYSEMVNNLGIPAINTQLINMKNVIDGSEQDIRNEITKAGGLATESQVLAMTAARNKTMIQNYNNLLQTRDDMYKQVDTMIGLDEKDRDYAKQQIDDKLGFDQKQIEFADKALTNAQDSLNNSGKLYGWDAILKAALATGDPHAVARINSTMGDGFDLETMSKVANGELTHIQLANGSDVMVDKAGNIVKTIGAADASKATKDALQITGMRLDNAKKAADLAGGSGDKLQQKLEQDYRSILVKEVSSRSGTLGTEDAKVAQANHLASLINQYYDPATGNYNVPKSQYGELVLGLAGMISKTGTPTDSQVDNINQRTGKGDLLGALTYITGAPQNGTTQEVLKNLVDSIDRQAQTAVQNREAGLKVLRGLAPTDLEQSRKDALEANTLVPYTGIQKKGGDKNITTEHLSNAKINGLTVNIPGIGNWTAPDTKTLEAFKKDHGIQ